MSISLVSCFLNTWQVEHGDITPVMLRFEEDMRHPLRNAAFGDLIEATLIQVQKTKVDLQLAISAVDKLLQSNELNFHMMALVPAVVVAWVLVRNTLAVTKHLVVQASVTSSGSALVLLRRLKRHVARSAHTPHTLAAEGELAYIAFQVAQQVRCSS